jgi:hypothetical protein
MAALKETGIAHAHCSGNVRTKNGAVIQRNGDAGPASLWGQVTEHDRNGSHHHASLCSALARLLALYTRERNGSVCQGHVAKSSLNAFGDRQKMSHNAAIYPKDG